MAAQHKDFPHHYFTLEEYFALERVSEARFEYWDGDILCVSGGSVRHYTVSHNFILKLSNLMEGRDGRAFSGIAPIRTPSLPPYRYPDASVVCGEPNYVNVGGIDALTNPVLIIEVLSPGTGQLDKKEKR